MITVDRALKFYRLDRGAVQDMSRMEKAIEHLRHHFTETLLQDIDVPACRAYKAARKLEKVKRHGEYHEVSDATIARELSVLRAAANHALKWKRITLDKMPTFDIDSNLPKNEVWLFKDELQRLFDAAKGDAVMGLYLLLLYMTGSRRGAIEELEWTQLDFNKKIIHLKKPGEVETKKRRPTVPMGKLYATLLNAKSKSDSKYVLGSNSDKYKSFVTLLEKADLVEVEERDGRPAGRVTPHCLRHSRATHLLEAGMSPYAVGKLLGDNASTIERVYGHACISNLDEELGKYS